MAAEKITQLAELTSTQTTDLLAIVDDVAGTATTKKITVSNLLATAGGANITVTDESADSTCFPIFVTSATGVLGPKSNTGLTFNSVTSDLSAVRIAGIPAVNLLDKNATEIITGAWTFNTLVDAAAGLLVSGGNTLTIRDSTDTDFAQFSHTGTDFNLTFTNTTSWNITSATNYNFDNSIFITEKAAANVDVSTLGQFWVRDDSPNTPMFTDDGGTDFELNAAGGTTITVVNEGIDTTCFPIFVTAATGVLGPKSNTGLTFDSVTGDLSALRIAGIVAVNLLDKNATETIAGAYTFTTLVEAAAGVRISGGNTLTIRDSTDTDSAQFSHTGTDFNTTFVGTTNWNITNATNYRFDNSIFITEKAVANADVVALGQFWVRNDTPNTPMFTDDAGTDFVLNAAAGALITVADESADTTCFPVFVTAPTGALGPKSSTGLTFNSTTGDLSATLITGILAANLMDKTAAETFSGSLTISNILNCDGGVDVLSGGLLNIFDSTNTARAEFSHTGTSFNTGFLNTTNWNITNATNYKFSNSIFILEKAGANADISGNGQFWVRSDTPNTPMFTDDAGTDFELNASAGTTLTVVNEDIDTTCFPVFVTSATGVLGPKSNAGVTFNSATGDLSATLIAGIANANLLDKAASETIGGSFTFSNLINCNGVDVLAGTTLKIFDTANTDRGDFSHDGTDFNTLFVNTTDWNITGATNYKFDDSIFITEKAAANADVATLGQFWVRDDAPNIPMFTDDAGTDFELNAAGGTTITVADEAADSSCFPVFVTSATGVLGPKSNTGLTFNSATGDLSATLIAGIANANLMDKTASETFSGSLTISNLLNLNGGVDVLDGGILQIFNSGSTDKAAFSHDGTDFNIALTNTASWSITGATNYKFDNNVFITEKSVANADVAGLGQFWVRDDVPNTAMFTDDAGTDHVLSETESFIVTLSDETTALTTGTAKASFRMPYAFNLTEVRSDVASAPTGSVITVDINESGSTVLSTKITIDATEETSETAATPPVISDASLADNAKMTFDIDTVGSTLAGAGLKVTLIGRRP